MHHCLWLDAAISNRTWKGRAALLSRDYPTLPFRDRGCGTRRICLGDWLRDLRWCLSDVVNSRSSPQCVHPAITNGSSRRCIAGDGPFRSNCGLYGTRLARAPPTGRRCWHRHWIGDVGLCSSRNVVADQSHGAPTRETDQPKAEGLDISDDTTSKVYSSFFDNDTTRSENHTGENGETTTRSMRTETSALT